MLPSAQPFYGKSNFYLRQHHSEVVIMGKSEASVWAFRNTGVSPPSLQLLPFVNAGVCAFDVPIEPTGTCHPPPLLPTIRLPRPDCGRAERAACQPQDQAWPPGHQQVSTAGSVVGREERPGGFLALRRAEQTQQLLPGNRCSPRPRQ